jgi:hypothetical protein
MRENCRKCVKIPMIAILSADIFRGISLALICILAPAVLFKWMACFRFFCGIRCSLSNKTGIYEPLTTFRIPVSLASLIFTSLPGVSVLRLMRTFRVLRLFNKLQSLRVLINALASSIFPVGNAFLMVVLVCVVYAILGVELFSDRSPELFGSFTISAWTVST